VELLGVEQEHTGRPHEDVVDVAPADVDVVDDQSAIFH
jgi:hypothetical protein